jgi:hypothetical protein
MSLVSKFCSLGHQVEESMNMQAMHDMLYLDPIAERYLVSAFLHLWRMLIVGSP